MPMLHLHPFGFQASSLERIRENSQLLDFEQLGAGICQSHVGKQAGKVPLLNPISSCTVYASYLLCQCLCKLILCIFQRVPILVSNINDHGVI